LTDSRKELFCWGNLKSNKQCCKKFWYFSN